MEELLALDSLLVIVLEFPLLVLETLAGFHTQLVLALDPQALVRGTVSHLSSLKTEEQYLLYYKGYYYSA
jgi:hypothetical protein